MRIIAGAYKSRTLVGPKGDATRPTTDRARESLFNVLQHHVRFENADVLDLFAGSGALAFEAVSRGAKTAVLVERDRKALAACHANATALAVSAKIVAMDVFTYLRQSPCGFDLIFADPPYEEAGVYDALCTALLGTGWLAEEGMLVLEHRSSMSIRPPEGSVVVRELKAGEATFTILREREASPSTD